MYNERNKMWYYTLRKESVMTVPDPKTYIKDNDKLSLPLFFAYVLLVSVLATITLCALSAMTIRGIDDVLSAFGTKFGLDAETADMLSVVFAQLDHAELSVHHEVPAILSLLFSLCIGQMLRAGKKAVRFPFALTIIGAVLVGLIFAAVSLTLSVWMTDVNDIRFGDIVRSLLDMIRAGVLDSL